MKIQQLQYSGNAWKIVMHPDGFDRMHCQLVLALGEYSLVRENPVFNHLERSYPEACIILCATEDNTMFENIVVVTAVEFDNTSVLCAQTSINDHKNNFEAGKYLRQQLQANECTNVYMLADGAGINGRDLVNGFNTGRPVDILNSNQAPFFIKRLAGLNKLPGEGTVVAVVLKGDEQDLFQAEQYLRIFPTLVTNGSFKF